MLPSIEITKRSKLLLDSGLEDWRDIWLLGLKDQSHSYFLSWPWIEHWLNKLPLDIEVDFLVVEANGSRAVCMLGHRKEARHGFINSDSYYLHYAGQPCFDSITLECNQILAENPGPQLLRAILDALPKGWDELHLPALDVSCFPANCLGQRIAGYRVQQHQQLACYFVDLTAVSEKQDSYLILLSKNTRSNIRRARKGLSKLGPLRLISADKVESALAFYEDLVAMHQESWQKRGEPGAFANNWLKDFHKSLIESRFTAGEIQLLRIVCGEETVGCLYNFVCQGKVYYYQSGFNYRDFGKYKPGLICHSLAIPYNASLGHRTYNFLAGDSQYKKSLSTDADQMVWCTIQKPRLSFKFEQLAKSVKARFREQNMKGLVGDVSKRLAVKLFAFRVEIFYLLSRDQVIQIKPTVLVNYRLGTVDDIRNLNASEFDYNEASIAYSNKRLVANDAFVLGEVDGQVAFYCWISFGQIQAAADLFWPTSKDMACIYKVFTHRSYRGKSIYPASYKFIISLAKQRGINHFTTYSKDINLRSRRSIEKVGYEEYGRVVGWNLIGKEYRRPNAKVALLLR